MCVLLPCKTANTTITSANQKTIREKSFLGAKFKQEYQFSIHDPIFGRNIILFFSNK